MPYHSLGSAPRLGVLLVVSTLLAACGGAASPSPAVTVPPPSASPVPSSSSDVAAAFVKEITSETTGTLEATGELTFGPLSGAVKGDFAFQGSNSRSTMTIDLGGRQQSSEQVTLLQSSWRRTAPGPWLKDAAPADDSKSLGGFLKALLTVEDLGLETRDGRRLHHLRPKTGSELTPDALGLDSEGMTGTEVTLEFFAESNGTPAIMAIGATWTQVAGGHELGATMTLDFAFTGWGQAVTIAAPDDVWTLFTSKPFGYSMAHPAGWTVKSDKEQDAYLQDDQPFVYVAPQPVAKGMTTDSWHDELLKTYRTQLDGPPDSDEAATLSGESARRLLYHFVNANDIEVALVDYVLVHDGKGWEVLIATPAGEGERDDIDLFETFVASFAFAE